MDSQAALTTKGQVEGILSAYQPTNEEAELCKQVRLAYEDGTEVLNYSYKEFNNKSFIERMNEDQRAWLSWTPEQNEGEDAWRWTGVRPITRNKVISMAAHLTSQLLIPNAFAQNQDQKEDRDAAYVMKNLIEHNIKKSNYETAFLFGVIAGLVNPISYFEVEYVQATQEIWKEGKKSKEEVVDDIFSGFQNGLIPPDEMLFENPYQFEWQKQDWIIRKRFISYGEAQAKWGEHENFVHVQPGKKVIMHEDNLFYNVEDVNDSMVEEVCYKNRRKDLEVYFLAGVYMSNSNVKYNPFIHRTNKNKPKYNTVKYGFEPIDAMRFIGYKSLVAKMSNDQEAADREWQMYFDASFLATFPPTVTMGAGHIDRSVMTPAMMTNIPLDAKIQALNIANPNPARAALAEAERSLNESSLDPQSGGFQQGPQKTARESVILQQNAETNSGLAAKMIGVMVKEVGNLIVDDIIRYQTVGETKGLVGDMTYKTFLVDGKVKEGQNKTVQIRFTDRFTDDNGDSKPMIGYEKRDQELDLYEEAGDEREIYDVNPIAFSKMDYLITIDVEKMLQKNDAFERAFKLETYDRAIRNPLVQQDPESQLKITRDFLFEPLMKGEASSYLPKIAQVAQQMIPGQVQGEPQGKVGGQSGMTSSLMSAVGKEKQAIR